MSKIIRRKLGDPLSAEALQELEELVNMPHSTIDTKDIPEWTPEQWAAAKARRRERLQAVPELQKRAS